MPSKFASCSDGIQYQEEIRIYWRGYV